MDQQERATGNQVQFNGTIIATYLTLGVFAVTAASLLLFSNALTPSNYKTLHFALNYESEFLKRGLVGELFRSLGISPWGNSPSLFVLLVFLLLSAIYTLAASAILRHKPHPVIGVILLALWASPAALPHLAADFGRLDSILILLLGTWAVCSHRMAANGSLLLLAFMGCTALLIHEIALFATIPIGFALWLVQHDEPLISLRTLAFGTVISLAFTLVWTFGNADVLTPLQVLETVAAHYGPRDYSVELIMIVLFGDISDNAAYSAQQAAHLQSLNEHLKFVGIMFGPLLMLGALATIAVQQLPRHGWTAILTCLTPLLLYLFGYDYFRWLSFVLINFTILWVWITLHNSEATDAIVARWKRWQWVIFTLSFLFLVVGPLGIFTSFALHEAPLIHVFRP